VVLRQAIGLERTVLEPESVWILIKLASSVGEKGQISLSTKSTLDIKKRERKKKQN
jgi:hypothetical protein